MIICPNCSKEHEDNIKFCDQCGTKLIPTDNASPVPDAVQSTAPNNQTQGVVTPQNPYQYQPQQQAVQPQQQVQPQQVVPPQQYGGMQYQTQPQQQGMHPQQYGAQPQPQPQQQGMHPQQYGAQPQPQYRQQGMPPQQYGAQPQQYGVPPQYQHPYAQPNPAFGYPFPQNNFAAPAGKSLIDLAKSSLFLVAAILYTVCIGIDFISTVSNISVNAGLFGEYIPFSTWLGGIISVILSIITVVALWLIYSSAAGKTPGFSSGITGLTVAKVVQIIYCVFMCIALGLIIIAGIFIIGTNYLYEYLYDLFGYRNAIGSFGFLLIFVSAIVLVIGILLFRSVLGAINSAVMISKGLIGQPKGTFAAVMFIISGGFICLSSVYSLSLAFASISYNGIGILLSPLSQLISGIANILFAVILFKFVNIAKANVYNAIYFNR